LWVEQTEIESSNSEPKLLCLIQLSILEALHDHVKDINPPDHLHQPHNEHAQFHAVGDKVHSAKQEQEGGAKPADTSEPDYVGRNPAVNKGASIKTQGDVNHPSHTLSNFLVDRRFRIILEAARKKAKRIAWVSERILH
jgi:uncharacterized protein involved in copper resistance